MVIDAHQHVHDFVPGSAEEDADLDARLAKMDERGVDQAVLIAAPSYLRPDGIKDTARVNDSLAAYRARRPDRFPAAVGVVEPLYGERGLAEIDRCARDVGLSGISFHTRFQGVANDHPWVRRYLERMSELGLVAFVHAVGESAAEALWKTEIVARELPDLPFVVLDAFSTFEQSTLVPYVAERCPNVVFDTATAHGWAFPAAVVARCGAGRVAYGSDMYSGSQSSLTDLLHADLLPSMREAFSSDEDRDLVMGGTISRVLHLGPPA